MNVPILPADRVTAPDYGGNSYLWEGDFAEGDSVSWGGLDWQTARHPENFSAVFRCIALISQSMATLGVSVFDDDGEKKTPVRDNVDWLLNWRPNDEHPAFIQREVLGRDALSLGNGYAEIERTRAGTLANLYRLDPCKVELKRDERGKLFYRHRQSGGAVDLAPAQVLHFRGPSPDGLVGYSIVGLARMAISLGLSMEQFGQRYFRRGPMPGGILDVPMGTPDEERKRLRAEFQEVYGGSRNAGNVIALPGGFKFTPAAFSNEDAQFLNSRAFQVEEICRWFGVPPYLLGIMSKTSYASQEQQAIDFVTTCLLPWCLRFEGEWNVKLFPPALLGKRRTRHNVQALLRGDSKAQTEALTKQVGAGIISINEARRALDYNAIADGDEHLVQGAMAPLEQILEAHPFAGGPGQPPAPPAGGSTESDDAGEGDGANTPEAIDRGGRLWLAREFSRLIGVNRDKATRARSIAAHLAHYDKPIPGGHFGAGNALAWWVRARFPARRSRINGYVDRAEATLRSRCRHLVEAHGAAGLADEAALADSLASHVMDSIAKGAWDEDRE